MDVITAGGADRRAGAVLADTLVPPFASIPALIQHRPSFLLLQTNEKQDCTFQMELKTLVGWWLFGCLADVPLRLICVVPDTLLRRPCLFHNPSVWRFFSIWTQFSDPPPPNPPVCRRVWSKVLDPFLIFLLWLLLHDHLCKLNHSLHFSCLHYSSGSALKFNSGCLVLLRHFSITAAYFSFHEANNDSFLQTFVLCCTARPQM